MEIGLSDIDELLEESIGLGGFDWLTEDSTLRVDLEMDGAEGKEFMSAFFEKFDLDPRSFDSSKFFVFKPPMFPLWFTALFCAVMASMIAMEQSLVRIGIAVLVFAFFANHNLMRKPKVPTMDISVRHLIAVARTGYWIDAEGEQALNELEETPFSA